MRIRFRFRRISVILSVAISVACFYSVLILYQTLNSTPQLESQEILKGFVKKYEIEPSSLKNACKAQDNIVFIKCMKCGTETMASILRRYGYIRNLSFVLPINKRLYIGWPYQISKYDYRPSINGFNILVEHAIYNRTTLQQLMPVNTKYITMIREPFSRFVSTFFYFKVHKITNITSSDPINEYLRKIDYYEQIYQSPKVAKGRYCIPDAFSVTKNLLAQCLGFPLGFPRGQVDLSRDSDAIQNFINQIDKDFTLVLIMDYYDESLVLLKRLFCWKMKDILYWRQNDGKYGGKKAIISHQTPENLQAHKQHDFIDYKIYHHFNETFWKKVREQSADFFDEVKSFQKINQDITSFCQKNLSSSNVKHVNGTLFTEAFTFTGFECKDLKEHLLRKLGNMYDKQRNSTKIMSSGRIKALC